MWNEARFILRRDDSGKGGAPSTLAMWYMHLKSVAGGIGWQKEHVRVNSEKDENKERN